MACCQARAGAGTPPSSLPAPIPVGGAGVGGGRNLLNLEEMGYDVSGFDVAPDAVRHCHQLGIPDVAVHDLEQPWPCEPCSATVVVLLDVIERKGGSCENFGCPADCRSSVCSRSGKTPPRLKHPIELPGPADGIACCPAAVLIAFQPLRGCERQDILPRIQHGRRESPACNRSGRPARSE